MQLSATLGELKASGYKRASVKDELRANLIKKLRAGETLFPGIIGYSETVIPQLVNAILARHNIILLGLRGQAKSRIIPSILFLLLVVGSSSSTPTNYPSPGSIAINDS
jgi:magnesium chelatase subunit I